jgi:HPt (histidine-containing phosphotransfer) domain-containing protein
METNESAVLDLSAALKATEGDIDLLRDVVDAFLEEYPTLLAELERALGTRDTTTIRRASHTLRGSLRLFGDAISRELAERLEGMGVTGELDHARSTYQALQHSLDNLRKQLCSAMQKLGNTPTN